MAVFLILMTEDIADRIIFYKSCYKMVLSIGIPGIQSSDLCVELRYISKRWNCLFLH